MYISSHDPLQLRNPQPNIVALGKTHILEISACDDDVKTHRKTYIIVIIEALLDHVELPVLSGIISYSCAVQPVAVVTADIMIHLQGGKVPIMKHGHVRNMMNKSVVS